MKHSSAFSSGMGGDRSSSCCPCQQLSISITCSVQRSWGGSLWRSRRRGNTMFPFKAWCAPRCMMGAHLKHFHGAWLSAKDELREKLNLQKNRQLVTCPYTPLRGHYNLLKSLIGTVSNLYRCSNDWKSAHANQFFTIMFMEGTVVIFQTSISHYEKGEDTTGPSFEPQETNVLLILTGKFLKHGHKVWMS